MDDRGVSGCVLDGGFLWLVRTCPPCGREPGFGPAADRSEPDDEAVLSFGRTATPQPPRRRRVHTGEWVRAVASLGLGFEAGLWNASMISVAPCSGAGASKHLFSKRCGLSVNEALSRLNHWTVGACPRPCGYGRDGATRKGVRTALSVF